MTYLVYMRCIECRMHTTTLTHTHSLAHTLSHARARAHTQGGTYAKGQVEKWQVKRNSQKSAV
jgi:hypothetical protein